MNEKQLSERMDRLERLNRINQRVMLALFRNPPDWIATADAEGITCALCNDAAWWPANGFSEADRQAFCGPDGLDCPGFDGKEG